MLSGSSPQMGKLSVKNANKSAVQDCVQKFIHQILIWSTIIDVGLQNKNITILFKMICMTLYHLSPNQSCHFDEVTHSDGCYAWSALISFLPWKHLRTHLDHE